MSAIKIGRICVKNVGREAGRRCIIVNIIDQNFSVVTGPKTVTGVKRRRVNSSHIEPTELIIDIKRDATDEEIVEAFDAAGLLEEMKKIVKPSIP